MKLQLHKTKRDRKDPLQITDINHNLGNEDIGYPSFYGESSNKCTPFSLDLDWGNNRIIPETEITKEFGK